MQENELVSLVLAAAFLTPFFLLWRALRAPALTWILAAVLALTLAAVATVFEDLFWMTALNLAEHFFYALSGVFFAIGCWRLLKGAAAEETGP